MNEPIEIAYRALAGRVAGALVAAGFLTSADRLQIDPEDAVEPDGEAADLETVAFLLQLTTGPDRVMVGSGAARYAVRREARVELAVAGPDKDRRDALLASALAALAPVGIDDPTLGQAAERSGLTGREDGDLPPNGRKVSLTYFVRVRSGDPLGLTA